MVFAENVQRFLRSLLGRWKTKRDLDDELKFHIEMETQKNEKQGLDPNEARRRALMSFGGLESTKEQVLDTYAARWLFDLMRDLRFSMRALSKRPSFTFAIIVTISIAAGTAAVMLTAARQVFWTPLPNSNLDRIVMLHEVENGDPNGLKGVSPGNFLEWKHRSVAFEAMGLAAPDGIEVIFDGRPASFATWSISQDFLDAIGLVPMLGKAFAAEEYEKDISTQLLVTYQGWSRLFGKDESIIGKKLDSAGGQLEIIGVLPADVALPSPRDFWIPRSTKPWDSRVRSGSWMVAVARLADSHSHSGGQADIDRVSAILAEEFPDSNGGTGVQLRSYRETLMQTIGPAVRALSIATIFFLVAASATIASILLTRLHAQGGELAMRQALGATASDLVRQVLAELLIIGGATGAVSAAVAVLYIRVLTATLPKNLPLLADLQPDLFVVISAFIAALLITLVCAVLPIMYAARGRFASAHSSQRSAGAPGALRFRSMLIALQVTIAVVMLIGAVLMMKSLSKYLEADIGFAAENRVALQVFADRSRAPTAQISFFNDLITNLNSVTGVESVTAVSAVPFHPHQIDPEETFARVDDVQLNVEERLYAHTIVSTPGYFELMDIDLRHGRSFSAFDQMDTTAVAIINESMSNRYWPNINPIGKRVAIGIMGAPVTAVEIVGIAENTRSFDFDSPHRPEIYVPHAQTGSFSMTLVVKTNVTPASLIPELQSAFWEIAPQQSIFHTTTLSSLIDKVTATRDFVVRVLGAFAFGAVSLSILGIYSLVSYTVILRRREFGIRMAIGATPSQIHTKVMGRSVIMMVVGALPGLLLALLLAHWLQPLLYGIEPFDLPTYLGAVLLIFVVGLVATFLPVWHTGRQSITSLLNSP